MKLEIILIVLGVIVAVIAFFSSKWLRTVSKESMLHPRESCEIVLVGKEVSVNKIKNTDNLED